MIVVAAGAPQARRRRNGTPSTSLLAAVVAGYRRVYLCVRLVKQRWFVSSQRCTSRDGPIYGREKSKNLHVLRELPGNVLCVRMDTCTESGSSPSRPPMARRLDEEVIDVDHKRTNRIR